MASINEQVVREYFETLGFCVLQPNKHQVAARHKLDAEEIDLLVVKPGAPVAFRTPEQVVWSSAELETVPRAIVSIRGWHTDRFSPAVLKKNPDIFHFTEPPVIKAACRMIGPGPLAKILCLSGLSVAAAPQGETLAMMRENGIDGILPFRTMLLELQEHIDLAKNYEKSDLLQTLRILKTYDLIKDPQLDLFEKRKRRKIG
jgi:hypothetical protein